MSVIVAWGYICYCDELAPRSTTVFCHVAHKMLFTRDQVKTFICQSLSMDGLIDHHFY